METNDGQQFLRREAWWAIGGEKPLAERKSPDEE